MIGTVSWKQELSGEGRAKCDSAGQTSVSADSALGEWANQCWSCNTRAGLSFLCHSNKHWHYVAWKTGPFSAGILFIVYILLKGLTNLNFIHLKVFGWPLASYSFEVLMLKVYMCFFLFKWSNTNSKWVRVSCRLGNHQSASG